MTYGPYRDYPTVVLRSGEDTVQITTHGATVLDWKIPNRTGPAGSQFHLFDGYASDKEVALADGARGAIMVPFSNRISNSTYTFRAKTYTFTDVPAGPEPKMHGLVLGHDFEVVSQSDTKVTLRTEVTPQEAYPWHLEVTVSYQLESDSTCHRLNLEITAGNLSEEDAPVGIGWHPYLNYVGGTWEQAEVEIPARTQICPDEGLLPLPGQQAFQTASAPVVFRSPQNLDVAYTDLVPDPDGVVRGRLIHPSGAITTIEYASEVGPAGVGILHVFTGETLPHRPRQSLAYEPCLFMTDQFNRAECASRLPLPAGESRSLRAALVHRD